VSAVPAEQEVEAGRRILGRYTILGKLTQGGMAEVYLARQQGPAGYSKLVVVKRVRPNLANDKDFVAMFVNEARLAALINHPNVVQIFDLGQDKKDWFLAMEFLDGRDMLQVGRACRAHNKAVPFDVTARIIADACAGLEHAHRLVGVDGKPLNLVHRDMSPENLLITFEGQVKVVDFGIAKARDNAFRTQAGQIKGKLGYVAPEAILGKELDGRADIFAIGATLYLFLCGRPAFTGSNPMEIFERSLQPPEAPSKLNPRVPPMLEEICIKCLQQDPKKRYRTAGELRGALEGYMQSTKRPLGPAQLSQFMQILFPPDKDPIRQRIEQLMASVDDAVEFELGSTSLNPNQKVLTAQSEPSASDLLSEDDLEDSMESTAVVPPEERPDATAAAAPRPAAPAAAPPPPHSEATARGPAFGMRSVEIASQLDGGGGDPTLTREPFVSDPSGAPAAVGGAGAQRSPREMTVELSPELLQELRDSASGEGMPVGAVDAMDEPTLGLDDLHVDVSAEPGLPEPVLEVTDVGHEEHPRPGMPPPLSDDDFSMESLEESIEQSLSDEAPARVAEEVHFGLEPVSEPTEVGGLASSLPESLPSEAPPELSNAALVPLGSDAEITAPGEPTAAFDGAVVAPPPEIIWRPAPLGKRLGMLVAGMLVGALLVAGGLYATGDIVMVQQRLGLSQ
jgi:serine/threonine-protein kinase